MTAMQFIRLPPVKAKVAVDNMTSAERGILEYDIRALLQGAAWKWGYLNRRGSFDDRHSSAVKNANQILRTVRKAVGYTYPRNDIHV